MMLGLATSDQTTFAHSHRHKYNDVKSITLIAYKCTI